MEQYFTLAVYGLILLFLLVQWFLSVRPWFIWGLLMPLLFGAIWYVVQNPPDILPIADFFGAEAVDLFSEICRLGLLLSLVVYVLCRATMLLKKAIRARRKQRRVEERRLRQEQQSSLRESYGVTESALPGEDELPSGNPS